MNLTLVEQITKKQLKSDIPVFKAGDTLKVYVKIKDLLVLKFNLKSKIKFILIYIFTFIHNCIS